MGLDMYLTKRYYIGGQYDFKEVRGVVDIQAKDGSLRLDAKELDSLEVHVGYWRKANAIHGWFVNHCSDSGEDDCRPMWVSVERLIKLRELCQKILDMPEGSQREQFIRSNLPPTEGFFFGGTDIDEYYFQDLRDTVEILKNVSLKENEDPFFDGYRYQASW